MHADMVTENWKEIKGYCVLLGTPRNTAAWILFISCMQLKKSLCIIMGNRRVYKDIIDCHLLKCVSSSVLQPMDTHAWLPWIQNSKLIPSIAEHWIYKEIVIKCQRPAAFYQMCQTQCTKPFFR